jgi:hypothetical protein
MSDNVVVNRQLNRQQRQCVKAPHRFEHSVLRRIFWCDGVDGYINKPGFRFTPITFLEFTLAVITDRYVDSLSLRCLFHTIATR